MRNGSAARLALVVLVITLPLTSRAQSQQSVAASEMRSVWDGVYTDEQARRWFRRYWTLGVGSGAHMLVHGLLDVVREDAEADREATSAPA